MQPPQSTHYKNDVQTGQKTHTKDPGAVRRYFRVELNQLVRLRFILEAYEGLVVLTSLPGRAEVQWTVPRELAKEADVLACKLAEELTLVPIPRPPDWPDALP